MDTPPPPPPRPPAGTTGDPRVRVWTRWRELAQARSEGRIPETEYRRAVEDLRGQLDRLPSWPASPGAPVVLEPARHDPPSAPPPSRRSWRWSTVVAAVLGVLVTAALAMAVGRALGGDERTTGSTPPSPEPTPAASAPAAGSNGQEASGMPGVAVLVGPTVAQVMTSGPTTTTGAAVVVGTDGVLVTTADLVADAASVRVRLADGSDYAAAVVGSDPATDLAVLHVDAEGLPAAVLASTLPAVGDEVVALGSPVDPRTVVSAGAVRDLAGTLTTADATLTGLLRTDAPVPDRGAGGPLVDDRARVVGISLAPSGHDTGFAIPAPTAARVVDELTARTATRSPSAGARLGVTGVDVDPLFGDAAGLGVSEGALLVQVLPGGAADRAGLVSGDVVVAFDGEPVSTVDDLASLVQSHVPGDQIQLEIVRDGAHRTLDVTLGAG